MAAQSQAPPLYLEAQEQDVEKYEQLSGVDSPVHTDTEDYPSSVKNDPKFQAELADDAATSSSTDADHRDRGPKLSSIPVDSDHIFIPTRIFWTPFWNTFSAALKVQDISEHMAGHWQGAANKEYRELAKSMYDKYYKAGAQQSTYVAEATDKIPIHHRYSFRDAQGNELVDWKHGWYSGKEVALTFPPGSSISQQPVYIKRVTRHLSRDRVFTFKGVMYAIEMDAKARSNQVTLFKLVEGKKYPVARYGMKFGSAWFVGGVLAVDTNEVDEVIAVLACLVAVRQSKQRVHERSGHGYSG